MLEKVYESGRLRRAWQQVRKNAGAAGIDRMTVEEFAQWEEALLGRIQDKLRSGSYRFQPARRVEVPKPGTTRTRQLGIPVVIDWIVGTSMHSVLEEIFDPDFSANPTLASERAGASNRRYGSYEIGERRENLGNCGGPAIIL